MEDDTEPKTDFRSNVPEYTVSELAFSVKRTIEDCFERIRVRGELSRVSIPKSGHLYTSLKDDKAVIDAVCWKGVLSRLSIKPEEGLEVICTGKMTTYPGNSRYQLVIDSMELAGEGALLKMLEERKKKLAAEGLFDANRKKNLPFLPQKIGVVTSPTGAVIRDIIHRLQDRFPRHVLVWPVKVQGAGSAEEIASAIEGFNNLSIENKPDLLIVARGGGSLEDLMPFNEEVVVRAVAKSNIPIISAVGHETDTTLIDYVSDVRAPTPTGAAEIAVPVRINLIAQVADDKNRLINGICRLVSNNQNKLETQSAKLGDPMRLLETKIQHTDRLAEQLIYATEKKTSLLHKGLIQVGGGLIHPAHMLANKQIVFESLSRRSEQSFAHYLAKKTHKAEKAYSNLRPPIDRIKTSARTLHDISGQLTRTGKNLLQNKKPSLDHSSEKLELLSFKSVLNRGFTVIRDQDNNLIKSGEKLKPNQFVNIEFKNNLRLDAQIIKDAHKRAVKTTEKRRTDPKQETLF